MTKAHNAIGAIALLVALVMIASAVTPLADAGTADNGSAVFLNENEGRLSGEGSGDGISISYQYMDNQHAGYYLLVDLANHPKTPLYCIITGENGTVVSDETIPYVGDRFEYRLDEPLESKTYGVTMYSTSGGEYSVSCSLTVSDVVPSTYIVNVSVVNGEGGSVTHCETGNNVVTKNGSLTIIVKLKDGYHIGSVTCDMNPLSPKSTADEGKTALYVVENVTSDHNVVVTFEKNASPSTKYKVTAKSADDGGEISPEVVELAKGETAIFTITPNEGYTLNDVKVNGISVNPSNITRNDDGTFTYRYTHNVEGSQSIVASFKQCDPEKTYTIDASAGTNGSITPSGKVSVNSGESISFKITPNSGYKVDSVLVDGKAVSLTGDTYKFLSVTDNHKISVTFKKSGGSPGPGPGPSSGYTINATAGAGGSISPQGSVSVSSGSSKTFNFTPNNGYEIDTLLVDGKTVYIAGNSYTFENVTSNHTISVTFKKVGESTNYTISASAGSGGKITPSGKVSVAAGGSQTFTISADKGYEIDHVTVNGKEVTINEGSYTFSNVNADQLISVTFKEIGTEPTPSEGDDGNNTMYYVLIAIVIIIILIVAVYLFMRSKH